MRGMTLPLAAIALALAGCSGTLDRMSEIVPNVSDINITSFEWNPYSKASASVAPTFKRPAPRPDDYVNADGSCAGAAAPEGSTEQPVAPAVALQMTECAVVRVLGAPEKVEIGANERGERSAKLLYSRGDRPGLYSFTGGRLKQIERVAEPAPPLKKRPAAKPRRSVT